MKRLALLLFTLLILIGIGVLIFPQRSRGAPAFTNILKGTPLEKLKTMGVLMTDYNSDGYLDLYFPYANKLFRNNKAGSFTDVTGKSGLASDVRYNSYTGIFADFNNDGCPDLYRATRLFKNNCNGTFTEISNKTGIDEKDMVTTGVAVADFDNDGLLDIYAAHLGVGGADPKTSYRFEENRLYKNEGQFRFTDVTRDAGVVGYSRCIDVFRPGVTVSDAEEDIYKTSYQPIWFDYNNDGRQDLYVANDTPVSVLYRNDGGGKFTDVTKEVGMCRLGTGMGVDAKDYDNDGNTDLYMTNVDSNYLWRNNGDGTFTELGAEEGVADSFSVGWGTKFADFDNDGVNELYVVNGIASLGEKQLRPNDDPTKIYLDKLFKRTEDAGFIDISQQAGIYGNDMKEGAAFGDIDNDGSVEIFVASSERAKVVQNRLYKNKGNAANWLIITLIGSTSNRDAVGAKVTVSVGGKKQAQEVTIGSSFVSQSDLRLHFGLGSNPVVDSILVAWPSGKKTELTQIKANRIVTLKER